MRVETRGRGVADVLAYGLLTYIIACVFYNIGFFLAVGNIDSIPRAFIHFDTFLSLPLVPITEVAIILLNRMSVEVTLLVVLGLAVRGIMDTFVVPPQSGQSPRSSLVSWIHPTVRVIFALASIVAIFGVAILYFKFPEISFGAEVVLLRSLGAILALGLALFFVLARRPMTSYFDDALGALAAMYLMLLLLLVGLHVGVALQTSSPDHKIDLPNSKFAIGVTVTTVPTGIIFLEYIGPGRRASVFYGDQHVVKITTIPVSERVKEPTPILRNKSLFCDFVKSWARINVCAKRPDTSAIILNSAGHFEYLPSDDPRSPHAVSLSEFQALVAAKQPPDRQNDQKN